MAVLHQLQIPRSPEDFAGEVVMHAIRVSRRSSYKCQLYVMLFTESVYQIWCARNRLIFQNQSISPHRIFRDILFHVAVRCSDEQKCLLYL